LANDTENVYLAAGTQVFSLDISSGSENWRYPDKANAKIAFYTNPVLTPDGQLLVPSYDTNLYSLDPTTGSQNWSFEDSSNKLIGSPLVIGEMIYQPSSDHYLYALDLNGKLVWSKETGGQLWAQPTTIEGCDCIIVASMDHTIYSYNASSGSLLWQSDDLGGAMVGTPAVSAEGILYVGTFGSEYTSILTLAGSYGAIPLTIGCGPVLPWQMESYILVIYLVIFMPSMPPMVH
jgi:outer membrane protein assembly factor BamB